MALEKLHLKHLSKGWQLRSNGKKIGELYRTRAEAMAAAQKIAGQNAKGLVLIVEPPPRRAHRATLAMVSVGSPYAVNDKGPKVRYPKRNPAPPEIVAKARITLTERAAQFREWAAGHSKNITLPNSAFDRESFYEDHEKWPSSSTRIFC